MPETLLIISGGIEAVPSIKLAKSLGYYVVVSDINPVAPGFTVADDQIIASTYDPISSVDAVCRYHKNIRPIDGVMCMAADVPHTVASVAAELGLPGLPVSVANRAIDKYAMKTKFLHDGINIPKFMLLDDFHSIDSAFKTIGDKLVLKPVDSRGSRGVIRITPEYDARDAFIEARSFSPTNRVMVEQYLPGPQVSTESIIVDGEAFTPGFSDRNYEYLERYDPYFIENGGSLPSLLSNDIQEKTRRLVNTAARSLGVRNGIVKGDVVIYRGQPYIIELAARLSGGYFSSHEIPLSTGVNTIKAVIEMSLGHKINPIELIPKYQKYVVQRYVFPKPGKVTKIAGIEQAKRIDGVADVIVTTSIGHFIKPPTDTTSRAAMVITTAQNMSSAIHIAEEAVNLIRVDTW